MIYITLVLALIIFGGIFYYCIRNSRRFRVIETKIQNPNKPDGVFQEINCYVPQVKISGTWFYIRKAPGFPYDKIIICPIKKEQHLDPQDALEIINKFKSAGNYTIPSNQRLKSNQKAIHVD